MRASTPVRNRTRSTSNTLPPKKFAALNCSQIFSDLHVVVRPIAELKFSNRRSRRHPEKQLVQLTASIRSFGFNSPVLIDDNGTIVAGHARVVAAERAGLTHVPSITLSHLDPVKLRAYMIADNKLAEGATWDLNVLKVELTELCATDLDFSLETIGFEAVEVDLIIHGGDDTPAQDESDDVLPSVRTIAVTRLGDVWRMDRHMFACADALDPASYALVLGATKATLVISDAPYNVPVQHHVSGLGRHQHREFAMASGEMTPAEFTAFLRTVFGHLAAHSMDGSLHCLFMDHRHMDEMLAAGGATYNERKNLLVWKKTNASMGSQYRSQHELIFLYKHGRAPHINNIQLGANGRYRTNVLEYAGANTFRVGRDEELERHPTPKPVALIADLIRDSSHINDWVLDCFVGGGTIFIAAEKTHRRAAGIEIDPLYCDLSIERWQALTGKSAVLVSTGQPFAEVAQARLACPADAKVGAQP